MDKKILTRHQRFVCVVRWLNTLYTAYAYKLAVPEGGACIDCPQNEDCPSCTKKKLDDIKFGELLPVPMNFHILEQFTGKGSLIGHMGNIPSSEFFSDIFPDLHKEDTSGKFPS